MSLTSSLSVSTWTFAWTREVPVVADILHLGTCSAYWYVIGITLYEHVVKNRIDLTPSTDVDAILVKVKEMYGKEKDGTVTDIDGVKLDFPDKWVHLRK